MRQLSFFRHATRLFGGVFLFMIVVFLWLFYYEAGRMVESVVDDVVAANARTVQQKTLALIDEPAEKVRVLARLEILARGGRGATLGEARARLEHQLWVALNETPFVESIYAADTDGRYLQARRVPRLATRYIERSGGQAVETIEYRGADYAVQKRETHRTEFDPRGRPWYGATGGEPRIYWSPLFPATTTKSLAIAATFPVTGARGEPSMVFAATIPLQRLTEFVQVHPPSQNGRTLIVDRGARIIADPDGAAALVDVSADGISALRKIEEPELLDALLKAVALGERSATITLGGERYIAHFAPVEGPGWFIVALVPRSDLSREVNALLLQALLIALGFAVLTLAMVWYLSRALARPLARLSEEARYLSDFELDRFKGVRSRIKEVARLSDSLVGAVEGLKWFARYVPAPLVRQLMRLQQDEALAGREMELTLLFSDIQNFTTISEAMPAAEVLAHLNEYFDELGAIIAGHQGTVDKFIGDGIMAFWGAPQDVPDGARQACAAALACQARLIELNARWKTEGKPELITRMGLHTARVVIGNIGSKERVNYSAIGDGVNVAARLESLNKELGTRVLISQTTHARLGDAFECRHVGGHALKGRASAVEVYELVGEKRG